MKNLFKNRIYLKTILLLLAVFYISISCNDNDEIESEMEMEMETSDCVFEQIDENEDGWIDSTEQAIMNECFENRYTSKIEIEHNLIGEWDLVGHGEGWLPKYSQPCGNIIIKSDELIFDFEDGLIDTISTHEWSIKETTNGEFLLEVEPISYYVNFSTFCEEFIFLNHTPSDGNMYLYQKQ